MGRYSKRYFELTIASLLFCSIALFACKERTSSFKTSNPVPVVSNSTLQKLLNGSGQQVDSLDLFNVSKALREVYANTSFKPLWVKQDDAFRSIVSLLSDMEALSDDGLNVENYKHKEIRRTFEKARIGKLSEEELAVFDTTCTYYYLQASRDLLLGRLDVRSVDTEWFHRNDTLWLANGFLYDSLYTANVYPELSLYKSKLTAYSRLKKERKKYTSLEEDLAYKAVRKGGALQLKDDEDKPILHPETIADEGEVKRIIAKYYSVALPEIDDSIVSYQLSIKDSLISKIDVNLERLRWLPQQLENVYLIVNVPAMDLFLNIDNKDTMHMRVVVGKKSRPTPAMNADMVNIVFNPTWTVPPGIMKKDIIPGMNKKGSAYLEKKGLAIYTHSGKPLNPDSVNVTRANFKNYVFRQPSGYKNALGRVKFNLPNKHSIYLHDTPSRSDFKKKNRTKSSGCVRVQHPRDMAGYILTKINKEENSKRFVDSLINKNKMVFVPLQKRIPVHILYLTATEDSAKQHIVYWDDVYNKDEAIALQLK
ncbi:MAG: L,D-transpeptidase family protein [Flavipsychrobacter sp.]